ncbi:MAG TPA: PAS domain-containing protein, partial [Chroococcidiopsis sp.]
YRDRTWRYEYISQGTEAVFGFTPQELMADPMLWIMQVLPEDQETVFSTCFDHIFAETPYRLEFRLKRKDGNLRWIAGTFSPRWDAREQCWLVHGFCTDITDHKTAEEALHFSQDRLSLLVTANPAVIYSCRASGTYGATSVSPNVEAMLGYPPEAFLDDPQFWLSRLHPDDQARVMADAATLLTQDHLICEYRFLHRDGTYRWVHDELQVLCREQGQPVELVGYWIDISDRKQLEERLQVQLQKEQMLNQMMQAIHQSLDLDQIFATATTAIADIAPADRVEIVQYLPERGIWLNVADYRRCADWPSALGVEIPDEGNAIAAQLKRREIVRIDDAGTINDTVNPELSQVFPGAWLLVPICSGTSLWGSLSVVKNVVKNQPRVEWSESEVDLLVAVANQLAIAIHQSELYQQVQQLNATLETQVHEQTAELQQSLALEELLKRITDKVRDSLDEAQILQTAVNELGVGLRLEGCDTAIYDSDRTTSTIAYEYAQRIQPVKIRQFAMADSTDPDIYRRYLLRGRSCQFCFRHDSVMRPHRRGQFTILSCPIVDDQGILGDLWLFKPSQQHFTNQEIRLVKTVANQCAIALRQSRLYKAAQHQVEELERINQLKDDFLNTVSHEMRSPIANIKMATELLEICLNGLALLSDANSPIARYFQILKDECHREINLINDLLDLSRLDANTEPLILLSLDLAQVLPHLVEPFIDRAAT